MEVLARNYKNELELTELSSVLESHFEEHYCYSGELEQLRSDINKLRYNLARVVELLVEKETLNLADIRNLLGIEKKDLKLLKKKESDI